MPKFYDDVNALQQVTLNLEFNFDVFSCLYCFQSDQFVSHGFIYHSFKHENKNISGKRILCSNRRGRSGCGRTLSLYLKIKQPKYVYSTAHINVFFFMLLAGYSIPVAYQIATGCYEPRNAYRWMKRARLRLVEYRAWLDQKTIKTIHTFKMHSLNFKIGLSTITRDADNGLITGTTQSDLTTSQSFNSYAEMLNYNASYNTTQLYNVDYTQDNLGRITQ